MGDVQNILYVPHWNDDVGNQAPEVTPSKNHDYIREYESDWMTQVRLLGVSGQNEIKSSIWRVSHNQGWSCKSVGDLQILTKMRNYAPVWHRMCDKSKRSNDIKSSINKYVILVIWIHNWIRPIDQRGVSQKEAWWHLSVEKWGSN